MSQHFGLAGSRSPAPLISKSAKLRSRALASLLLAVSILAALPGVAGAVDMRPGEVITVGANETVNDDLYAFGRTVEVFGTVRGDVIAGAGVVTIAGTVTGDVMVGAGQIQIGGEVGGSVRAGGGNVAIDGRVGEDVLVGSGTLTLGPRATVGRDVYTGAGTAMIDGRVGRNLQAGAGDVTIGGQVGGDVDAEVGQLRLSPGASIAGQLRYTSENVADIAPGATVRGGIQRRVPERTEESEPPNPAVLMLIGWVRGVVGLFVLGLLLELLSPGIGRRTLGAVSRSPGTSVAMGIVLFLLIPLLAAIVFGFGLIVGGWWIGLIILAAYGIALISSVALGGMAIGRWLLDRIGRPTVHFAWALLIGVALLTLVALVPVAGGLLVGLIALVAFGGLALSTFGRPARPEPNEAVVAPEPPVAPAPAAPA